MQLTAPDIILLLFYIPAIWQGLSKGLLKQISSIASIFIAVWVSGIYGQDVQQLLSMWINGADPLLLKILGFLLVFVCCAIVLSVIAGIIGKVLKLVMLGWVNRLLGLVFSILTCTLILSLLVSLFDGANSRWMLVDADILASSPIYQGLLTFGTTVFPVLKGMVSKKTFVNV